MLLFPFRFASTQYNLTIGAQSQVHQSFSKNAVSTLSDVSFEMSRVGYKYL